jgi:hypothetical protein
MLEFKATGKLFIMAIINVHAHIAGAENEVKYFYSKLGAVCDRTPRNDVKIIMGDINAKIGKEDTFIPAVCQCSSHETFNYNGFKAGDLALSRNRKTNSTHFRYKYIHEYMDFTRE